MRRLLVAAVVVSSVVGCASVPMGDAKQDAALKTFSAPTDKAAIYIYRNESMGGAVKMDVDLDGQVIGQTVANTYLYKEVTPGKHIITSKAENSDTVEVDVKPGSLSYIWQEVKMGVLYARTKLHLASESDGKKGVLETKLAETK